MFNKKYIFESKKTKMKRRMFNYSVVLFILALFYTSLCFYSIYVARLETSIANEVYFKKSPDLIAVFTGDMGRIPFGIKKALEYEHSKILITGVYNTSTIKEILQIQSPTTMKNIDLNSNMIEIDYLARNTIENVIYTLRYLKREKNLNKVLIVSSDYHILRIKFILDMVKSPQDSYQFHFVGIESDYTQWRNIKILLLEIFKGLKALGVLFLWDKVENHPVIVGFKFL